MRGQLQFLRIASWTKQVSTYI